MELLRPRIAEEFSGFEGDHAPTLWHSFVKSQDLAVRNELGCTSLRPLCLICGDGQYVCRYTKSPDFWALFALGGFARIPACGAHGLQQCGRCRDGDLRLGGATHDQLAPHRPD